jgi:hypothetical protein
MGTKWHRYSNEQIDFLKSYAFGRSRKDITNKFNEVFNTELSIGQITSTLKRHNINTGRTGRFEKGMTPYNKGKKMSPEVYEKIKPTLFKKGQTINNRPVGSERIDKDGYAVVKVAEPNKWKLKHIAIWEQYNGPVPKNHCVIFLDGNIRNFNIDNLALITRAENLYLNRQKLRFNSKDLTESAVNIAKLNSKILERK